MGTASQRVESDKAPQQPTTPETTSSQIVSFVQSVWSDMKELSQLKPGNDGSSAGGNGGAGATDQGSPSGPKAPEAGDSSAPAASHHLIPCGAGFGEIGGTRSGSQKGPYEGRPSGGGRDVPTPGRPSGTGEAGGPVPEGRPVRTGHDTPDPARPAGTGDAGGPVPEGSHPAGTGHDTPDPARPAGTGEAGGPVPEGRPVRTGHDTPDPARPAGTGEAAGPVLEGRPAGSGHDMPDPARPASVGEAGGPVPARPAGSGHNDNPAGFRPPAVEDGSRPAPHPSRLDEKSGDGKRITDITRTPQDHRSAQSKRSFGKAHDVDATAPSDQEVSHASEVLDDKKTTDLLGMSELSIDASQALLHGNIEGVQSILQGLEKDPEGAQKLDAMAKELSNLLGTEVTGRVGADGKFNLDVMTDYSDNTGGDFPTGISETHLNIPSSGDLTADQSRYWNPNFRRGGSADPAVEATRLQALTAQKINELPEILNDMNGSGVISQKDGTAKTDVNKTSQSNEGVIEAPSKAAPPDPGPISVQDAPKSPQATVAEMLKRLKAAQF